MTNTPHPFGPIPSARQLAWHTLELYGFVHFTINTFTDKEWGYGDESPALFHPSDFDADQIVSTAKLGGLAGLILTAKHHDGFCLWPSAHTSHSVISSPWRNGRGDVVRELADACRRHGLRFGVYLSPWDRNHGAYGRAAYIEYYRAQLHELLTGYGELFEVWFDGANGGDGYYAGSREQRLIDARSYYDWDTTWSMVRTLQPKAVIFSDAGPDIRWVGNEHGIAGDPCWATLNNAAFVPGLADAAQLNQGQRNGTQWLPAECDVSIRPGWFYHATEDSQLKTADYLTELYFQSVGRGASLLLNLPPDRRGQIHPNDCAVLHAFQSQLASLFEQPLRGVRASASNVRAESAQFAAANLLNDDPNSYWSTDDACCSAALTLELAHKATISIIDIREYLPLGQRVDTYAIDIWEHNRWREVAHGQAIGARRLVRLPGLETERLRLRYTGPVCPAISRVAVF